MNAREKVWNVLNEALVNAVYDITQKTEFTQLERELKADEANWLENKEALEVLKRLRGADDIQAIVLALEKLV